MPRAFVALGSNLGEPRQQIERAFAELDALPLTRLLARSSLYLSAPIGFAEQPDFINAVAEVETGLEPIKLLQALLEIEHRHGRFRDFADAPRTLDLDLLLYGDCVLHQHGLTIPHPRMHRRAFVLLPLAEIAPQCLIPGCGKVAELLPNVAAQSLEKLDAAG